MKVYRKYILELIVFVCGMIVMALELVGSRILAPYLGTSIIVWTSLIGIILGFISIGYWYGGKIADQHQSYKVFSFIIFSGAISVGFIAICQSFVLNFIQKEITSIYVGTIIATLSLFAIPGALLGMVPPYAIRLKIETIKRSGETVGNIYAISTVGSIVGTFLTGFILIPHLGIIKILIILTISLILASLLVFSKNFLYTRCLIIILILIIYIFFIKFPVSFNKNIVADIETKYNRIWLTKSSDPKTLRPILSLKTDPYGSQSAMFLDGDDDLVFDYAKYYRLAKYFTPDFKNSLLIGGAAYSYPKDYLKQNPGARLDVVEIDPGVTDIAKKYFNLRDDKRLNIYHEDGRVFLNKTKNKYDVVFVDAFTSHASIPYQLTTVDTAQNIYNILNEKGAVFINIWSAIEGEQGLFLRSEYKTYKNIFPQVYLFVVDENLNEEKKQNIILLALKSNIKQEFRSSNMEINSYLEHLWKKEISDDVNILTDDRAPVDYYAIK